MKKNLGIRGLLFAFLFVLFFSSDMLGQNNNKLSSESNKDSQKKWFTFSHPDNKYRVDFPDIPNKIPDTNIYTSKDDKSNLFAISDFTPPDDATKKHSPRKILQTSIKALVLKKNVLLSETIYSIYKKDYVAVAFTGKIKTNNRPFRGKIILEGDKLYYLYSVLKDESSISLQNYNRFINSFNLVVIK